MVIFRILNGFWPSERRFVASQVQPFPGCCRTMGRKPTSSTVASRCRALALGAGELKIERWYKIGYCYKKGSPMSDVLYSSSILILCIEKYFSKTPFLHEPLKNLFLYPPFFLKSEITSTHMLKAQIVLNMAFRIVNKEGLESL